MGELYSLVLQAPELPFRSFLAYQAMESYGNDGNECPQMEEEYEAGSFVRVVIIKPWVIKPWGRRNWHQNFSGQSGLGVWFSKTWSQLYAQSWWACLTPTLFLGFLVDYRRHEEGQVSIQDFWHSLKQLAPCLVKAISAPDAVLKLSHFGHIF